MRVVALFFLLVVMAASAADPPASLEPKSFTYQTQGTTLGKVLDEFAKQTGVTVGRAKAETERTLRLDCQKQPFWEAVEKIARESDHRISFGDEGRKLQLVGGGDVTYRESPVSIDRIFRIAVKRVQCQTDLEIDRSYCEVTLGLNWEPGFSVFLVEQPGWSVLGRDNTGQDLRVDDPGQGRVPVSGPGVDLSVRLANVPRTAKNLTTLEGKFGVVGAQKMLEFDFEKPVANKDAKDAREITRDNVTVRLRTDFAEKSDLWSARLEFVYPEGGPAVESFEASAWLIDNHCWLTSADGKYNLDYNGGYELVAQGDRRAVIVYRFTDEADRKLGKPEDWTLHVRTPAKLITTDVKFKLENIPLP